MRPFLLEFDIKRNTLIYRQVTLDFYCTFKSFIKAAVEVKKNCSDFSLISKIVSITEFPIIGIEI